MEDPPFFHGENSLSMVIFQFAFSMFTSRVTTYFGSERGHHGHHPSRPSTAPATSAAPRRRSSVRRATRCAREARTWRPLRRRRRCRSSGSPGCPGWVDGIYWRIQLVMKPLVSLMMKLRWMAGCSIFFFIFFGFQELSMLGNSRKQSRAFGIIDIGKSWGILRDFPWTSREPFFVGRGWSTPKVKRRQSWPFQAPCFHIIDLKVHLEIVH